MKWAFTENASTKVDVHSVRQSLGVVGLICPFDFPAMVPMWFFPLAIAAANTVVLKPSDNVPSAALWMAELWREGGLPDGVFNVLNGDKVAVDGLLTHPDVASVSFVGSTSIANTSTKSARRTGSAWRRWGARNHLLVLPDAHLDLAADPAVNAGFGSAVNYSLFGDARAHGVEGVHFFTCGKVVTSSWLDPSHGGHNLGFPQNV